jgi:hypothetical protein
MLEQIDDQKIGNRSRLGCKQAIISQFHGSKMTAQNPVPPDNIGLNRWPFGFCIYTTRWTRWIQFHDLPWVCTFARLQLLRPVLSTYHISTSFIYLDKRVIRLNSCRTLSELLDEYGF